MNKKLTLGFISILAPLSMHGMNWLRPWDVLVRPEMHWQKKMTLAAWGETGVRPAQGFNSDDTRVNALQLWNCSQDALAAFNGFAANTIIGQVRIDVDAADNGIRGNYIATGHLKEVFSVIFGAYYKFNDYFWIAAYLPAQEQRLTDVNWNNLTQSLTPDDYRVQQYITNNFCTNMATYGDGLQVGDWKRRGLGDVNLMVEWLKNYPQRRELLHNVMLNWCIGVTIPTGLRTDPDKVLALPFGYDGSWGIVFGGGLRVTFGSVIRFGADVRLTHLFGNTADRRIKTAPDQTDFLLLAKASAYKDPGLIQLFSLYAQAYQICRGLSFLVGYQFLKKNQDTLQLNTCLYSNVIANTAISLREWTVHQAVINATYDIGYHMRDGSTWPQLMLFTRLPFNGRRSVAFPTIGAMLTLEF